MTVGPDAAACDQHYKHCKKYTDFLTLQHTWFQPSSVQPLTKKV